MIAGRPSQHLIATCKGCERFRHLLNVVITAKGMHVELCDACHAEYLAKLRAHVVLAAN